MSALPPKHKLPLSKDQEALLEEVRPLSCYKLHYQNARYPILSFLYAIYAGGEHALYCDHPGAFAQAYLTGHGAKVMRIFEPLMPKRDRGEANIVPGPAEWDKLMPLLRAELEQADAPAPMW